MAKRKANKGSFKFNLEKSYARFTIYFNQYRKNSVMKDKDLPTKEDYEKWYGQFYNVFPGSKNLPREIARTRQSFTYSEAKEISKNLNIPISELRGADSHTYKDENGEIKKTKSIRQSVFLNVAYNYMVSNNITYREAIEKAEEDFDS